MFTAGSTGSNLHAAGTAEVKPSLSRTWSRFKQTVTIRQNSHKTEPAAPLVPHAQPQPTRRPPPMNRAATAALQTSVGFSVVSLEEMQARVKADTSKHAHLPPMPAPLPEIDPRITRPRAASNISLASESIVPGIVTERWSTATQDTSTPRAPVKRKPVPNAMSGIAAPPPPTPLARFY